jgi:hypothetical protein
VGLPAPVTWGWGLGVGLAWCVCVCVCLAQVRGGGRGGRGGGGPSGPTQKGPPGKFPAMQTASLADALPRSGHFYHVEDNAKTAYTAGSVQYKKIDEFFWWAAATPTFCQGF